MSSMLRPAFASTFIVAGMTPVSMKIGSSPATANEWTRALGLETERRCLSSLVTRRAADPSLIGELLPAVTFQSISGKRSLHRSSWKASRRPDRESGVVVGRR
jgi:hypothetical protein